MMKKFLFYSTLTCMALLGACSDDDHGSMTDFAVAFEKGSVSLGETDAQQEVTLTFSRAATESGTVTVGYTANNAEYGTDFTTDPEGSSGSLSVPVSSGASSATFTFTKLQDPVEGTTKSVDFSIKGFSDASWVNGSTTALTVNFTPVAAEGGVVDVNSGGPTEPNQVYIDLSTGQQTVVRRDTWEIGLYNGTENRVLLNASLLVAAAKVTGQTDIDAVNETTELAAPMELNSLDPYAGTTTLVTVTNVTELVEGLPVGYSQYGNLEEGIAFTDSPSGNLEETAFDKISTEAGENEVYILSLGATIPAADEPIDPGSIKTTDTQRGFLKVRILSDGDSYTIQYAQLDATEHHEVTVAKDPTKNLTAFSFTTGETVAVEPAQGAWDLNVTNVHSYYAYNAQFMSTAGLTFSDYVLHNTLGGVGLYQVLTEESDGEGGTTPTDAPSYSDFSRDDVDDAALVYDNHAVVGSDWRSAFGGAAVKGDRYYIIKDADGNYYKFRFTAVLSAEGERGYPQFTYQKL